jgi:hypothetical protein
VGPYLQLRRWLADGTSTEHRAGAVSILAVVALLAWALFPLSNTSTDRTVGAVAGAASATGDGVSGPEAAAAAADAVGSPGAAVATQAGGPTGPSSRPTRAGGAGASPTGTVSRALTASDRGVTPSSIKVGFTVMDLANLGATGNTAVGIRNDTPKVIQALVDDANARGGVLGRKIQPVVKSVDLLSASDQQAKCLEFTRDDQVFAVVDTYTFLLPESAACVTQQNKTPLITAFPGTDAEIAAANPYLISLRKSETRVMHDLAYGAAAAGFFDKSKGFVKLGLVTHGCRRDHIDGPNGLKRWLREVGVTTWSEFKVGCGDNDEQAMGPAAVLQHRQDGVSHVMLVVTETGIDRYTATAASQQWHPKYFQSDYFNATLDANSGDYDPDGYDGTLAYTELNRGNPAELAPVQECSRRLKAAGLPEAKTWIADVEALTYCEHFELFLRAATAAGPDLTRIGFGRAVSTVGELRGTMTNYSRFDTPGKLTGGDAVALAQWRRDCKCWVRVGDFRPAWG